MFFGSKRIDRLSQAGGFMDHDVCRWHCNVYWKETNVRGTQRGIVEAEVGYVQITQSNSSRQQSVTKERWNVHRRVLSPPDLYHQSLSHTCEQLHPAWQHQGHISLCVRNFDTSGPRTITLARETWKKLMRTQPPFECKQNKVWKCSQSSIKS